MLNYTLKPSFEYQDPPWRSHVWKRKSLETNNDNNKRPTFISVARAVKFAVALMAKALAKRVKCTILYATETGKSERFAKSLNEIFKHSFDAKCLNMQDYDAVDYESTKI
jgi:nitric-oxide synthase, brain